MGPWTHQGYRGLIYRTTGLVSMFINPLQGLVFYLVWRPVMIQFPPSEMTLARCAMWVFGGNTLEDRTLSNNRTCV